MTTAIRRQQDSCERDASPKTQLSLQASSSAQVLLKNLANWGGGHGIRHPRRDDKLGLHRAPAGPRDPPYRDAP